MGVEMATGEDIRLIGLWVGAIPPTKTYLSSLKKSLCFIRSKVTNETFKIIMTIFKNRF
jgi:hypothetical protein